MMKKYMTVWKVLLLTLVIVIGTNLGLVRSEAHGVVSLGLKTAGATSADLREVSGVFGESARVVNSMGLNAL